MRSSAYKQLLARILRKISAMIPGRKRDVRFGHWIHLHLDQTEQELHCLKTLLPSHRRVAVDVGANLGYYSAELSRSFRDVVAFEINPGLASSWAGVWPNVSIKSVGLSDSPGDARLYIPLLKGKLPLYGWASLRPGNLPGTTEHLELDVRVERMDAFALANVDFIKIDVEGHELHVLRGATELLGKWRPNLLIEVKPSNLNEVRSMLGSLGYRESALCGRGRDSTDENRFFIAR